MTIALGQAVAPAFATSLFAYSVNSGVAGGYLIYIILLILGELLCGISLSPLLTSQIR